VEVTAKDGCLFTGSKIVIRYFLTAVRGASMYEGWKFNSGNYLFTTDTK